MDLKKLCRKILFPPVWVIAVLSVVCAAALIFLFVKGYEMSIAAYIIYAVSFYTLSVSVIFFSLVLPKQYRSMKQKLYDNPIGNRYMTDAVFRTHISLYTSLCINLLYAAINIISFVLYGSMWFICLAVYYIILAVMRFLLVRYARLNNIGENRYGELKRTVLCSCILMTVNIALSGAVLMILYQNKGYEYHGMLIYVMAAYTFYITTYAIINLIKYRRYNSPVMLMTKVIAMSSALVSMLSLETAMLSKFGQNMKSENRWLMIVLTGAGVSIIIVAMSAYMIIRSVTEMKTIKEK